ncbi:MAG: T9SS type A sorting domain-containing protein [Prevotella sp.]|nr:T9SS type A sorting domain-containing protein [Candidatus Prevotella equi]
MKKILLTISLLFAIMMCKATDQSTHLTLWSKDGTKLSYALWDKPKIEFSSNQIFIKSETVDIYFPLSDFSHFTYENENLTDVKKVQDSNSFSISENCLLFNNLPLNSVITIFSSDGIVMYNKKTNKNSIFIPLSSFPQGVYFVKTNGINYKFMKK